LTTSDHPGAVVPDHGKKHKPVQVGRDMRLRGRGALVLLFLSLASLPVHAHETYMVPMRDGVDLATDVYLPGGKGPWPTIVARTPYGRFGMSDLVDRGYAVVTQDMRGYYGSEGLRTPFETDGWGELRDGYDTLEWVANQSWCNGRIGTWGGSALGITQNMLAGSNPPDLLCQHILAGASDLYSQMFFQGGVLRDMMVRGWWIQNGRPEHLSSLLSHPSYDSRWELMNSERRAGGMSYAAMHVGGWYDIFLQGTLNAFMERQHNGGPGSAGNQKLVMGPWWHGGFTMVTQGELMYPSSSLYSRIWDDSYKMYDYYLRGVDSGWSDLPAVRYYVMGDVDDPEAPGNEWREAEDWPVRHDNLSLYLDGEWLRLAPGEDSECSYIYDPAKPVPTAGGANLVLPGGPMDQRDVEGRADVLVFSTPPLEVPVEVTGRVWVQLFASSNCSDTDFMVKLTDVYPDGRSMLVLDGALRARYRNSTVEQELMVPGEVYDFWVDLWSTSIVFNRGHRIRLAISSSNYPRFETNPNNGLGYMAGGDKLVAENTVYMGPVNPSRIVLPLAGPDLDGDGLYDIDDPLPEDPGPMPGLQEITAMIDDADSRIASTGDPAFRVLLGRIADAARERLGDGNPGGAGHLVGIILEALQHDPANITGPRAREVVDAALEGASGGIDAESYLKALDCIRSGFVIGHLVEELGEGAPPLLLEYLESAESAFREEGCRDGLVFAEWLQRTDVRVIAMDIHLARTGGAPGNVLDSIEGMLESAMGQYLEGRLDGAELMLSSAQRRLDGLVEYIPEQIGLLALLTGLAMIGSGKSRAKRTREGAGADNPRTGGVPGLVDC